MVNASERAENRPKSETRGAGDRAGEVESREGFGIGFEKADFDRGVMQPVASMFSEAAVTSQRGRGRFGGARGDGEALYSG